MSYTQIALVCFFAAASVLCAIASITILLPSTPSSAIWAIKPLDYRDLLARAPWSGIGFMALSAVMACAAWGCWRRKLWGWWLAMAIFVVHGIGDAWQIASGHVAEGILGVAVAAAIIIWLRRGRVKAQFNR